MFVLFRTERLTIKNQAIKHTFTAQKPRSNFQIFETPETGEGTLNKVF